MRYSGRLGISQESETSPGVWEETITEVPVIGNVKQTTTVLAGESDILPRHSTTTSIVVSARGTGPQDNSKIRYITYKGKNWQIRSIVDKPPKIEVYIGEEYHGPVPEPTPDAPE